MNAQSSGQPAPDEQVRERVRETVARACAPIAQSWPLKTFAYRNPLRGLEHLPFDEAVRSGRHTLGGKGYLPNAEYRAFHGEGAITDEAIDAALASVPTESADVILQIGGQTINEQQVRRLHLIDGIDPPDRNLEAWTLRTGGDVDVSAELWAAARSVVLPSDEASRSAIHSPEPAGTVVELPDGRTMSDWLGELTGESLIDSINDQMIKWNAAFLDEGMSGWAMPGRSAGFYSSWRELARHDWSGRLMGIPRFGRKIQQLPDSPEEAIAECLTRLQIPETRWTDYLSRQLAHLPGWAGFIRWRGENPDYAAQKEHPMDAVDFLAVRLFYEVELADVICRREWSFDATLPAIVEHWRGQPDEYRRRMQGQTVDQDATRDDPFQHAWRLFRLAQLLRWSPADVTAIESADHRTLLGWLDSFPSSEHGQVWLRALETSYSERLLEKLSITGDGADADKSLAGSELARDTSVLAQLVFCIDVRSEPMRRHIESMGRYETFGFAGFFGLPISYQGFDRPDHAALCPVILSPQYSVGEVARSDQETPLEVYASGSRWQQLGEHLFHDLKGSVVGAFLLIDLVGLFYAAWLAGKTFFQTAFESCLSKSRDLWARHVATRIPVALSSAMPASMTPASDATADAAAPELPAGFTLEQRTASVAGALGAMGLTEGFGRFVVVCGHGSTSANNPYFAAYNCGACGGGHGDANARVFTEMANDPDVRENLREQGMALTDETWFLAAKHDTVTDVIEMYDLQDVPETHSKDLQQLRDDLRRAGSLQAQQRITRLPQAPSPPTPEAASEHLVSRSLDWANVRPEWGLSGNAAFVLGRRELTDGSDLEGRVFLQSYDPKKDPTGAVLEALMTAPLVVAQWISMEYYFSAVDPVCYGSGSKVTHNVVSGVGVMHGAHGDLQTGLPLQSVNDGTDHYHKPVRLLAVVEAPLTRIESVVAKHELLQNLLHNEWIQLIAVSTSDNGTEGASLHRYKPDATWESLR